MRRQVILVSLVLLLMASGVRAQTPIQMGETVKVTANDVRPQLTFTVTEPQFVTMIAQGVGEGVDTYLTLTNTAQRSLISYGDNNGLEGLSPLDTAIENFYLLPGDYFLEVGGFYGDQVANVTLKPGDPGVWGAGTTEVISGTIVSRGRFRQTEEFQQNEIITISVLALTDKLDAALELRNAQGVPVMVSSNRDYERGDAVLNFTDPQITHYVIPEAGPYDIEINGTYPESEGDFQLFLTRYGMMTPTVGQAAEKFEGKLVTGGRLDFSLVVKRGELVTITAKALVDGLDTNLSILNPLGVIMAQNSDHGTDDPNLTYSDSKLPNLLMEEAGKYTVEVTSAMGEGAVEITVEHVGSFEAIPGAKK